MSSEWRAGSDVDEEGEEYAPASAAVTSADKKRAPAASSSSSVYERVASWAALRESAPLVATASSTAGAGRSADLDEQPAAIQVARLHPHQMSGLNWLKARFEMGISCILADEMGLGKTLQAISLLAHLYQLAQQPNKNAAAAADGRVGPFLILCPLTVLDNWSRELESYAPALAVQVYTGSKAEREEMQDDIRACIRALPKSERKDPLLPFHVLLTSYESALNDASFLGRFSWRAIVVDEAHRLKNADSALAQTLRLEYHAAWRLFLTGTPVQNDLGELWSLLWGLHPELFAAKKQFVEEFAVLAPASSAAGGSARVAFSDPSRRAQAHQDALDHLHAVVRPFMLRRLKEECALDIPPKREVILRTHMTPLQKGIYKNLLLKNSDLLGAGAGGGSAGSGARVPSARALVNIVQSLRKCATHPYTIAGVEPEPFREGPHIYESSGKFVLLVKLLRVLKRLGRRVLLFSTSVQSLDVTQDVLTYLGYSYERLDGSVRGEERFQAVANFSRTTGAAAAAGRGGGAGAAAEPTFVFLLSTRAGGVGLNLTVADTVIFLDSDWNPQQDLQAMARAHRIGQRRRVLVVRLLAANTLEEIILKRTQRKLLLTHNILEKGRFNAKDKDAEEQKDGGVDAGADEDPEAIGRSAKDLQNILQYGLDSLFAEGKADGAGADAAAAEMQEDEIEAIVTGRIEEEQAEAAAAAAAASASSSAAAESQTATAASASRPNFSRIATRALPSLEEAASASSSVDLDEADSSVYVYEGTNYKELAARDLRDADVDAELNDAAARGHKALQRMVAAARAAGELEEGEEDGGGSGDRYGSPGADRKRKSLTQESEEDRAARIARNKELAAKRLESARKRREQAEADRLASLQQRWDQHGYVSSALHIDEAEEARFDEAAAAGGGGAIDVDAFVDASAEWRGGEDEGEEEQKNGGGSDLVAPRASLCYVVGDATCPFVFAAGSGAPAGSVSQPPAAAASAEGEFASSFDEAAAAAADEQPSSASGSRSPASALLLVPVDASGSWGKGGVFRALDARSRLIGAQYELIGAMGDLAMGDVHVVTIPAEQLRPPPQQLQPQGEGEGDQDELPPAPLHVALCVVLARAKGQSYGAPSLHPESLSLALRKLSACARSRSYSVHLPRLGAQDPNLGWYAIERMLQKHVVARGVQCYVYYFDRKPRVQYRSPVKAQLSRASSAFSQPQRRDSTAAAVASTAASSVEASSASAAAVAWDGASSSAAAGAEPMLLDGADEFEAESKPASAAAASSEESPLSQFQDVFSGCVIYLDRSSAAKNSDAAGTGSNPAVATMSDSDARLLSRFIAAYDGEVSDSVSARVTHLVTAEPFLTPRLIALRRQSAPRAAVVQLAWVEQSVTQGRIDTSAALQVRERK